MTLNIIKNYWQGSYVHYWLYLKSTRKIDYCENSKFVGLINVLFDKMWLIRNNFVGLNEYFSTMFIYILILSLLFQGKSILFFGSYLEYSTLIVFAFIIYYLIFELKSFKDFINCKSFISFFSLIFLVLLISQFQSAYINFPITTIRQNAVLNYPFIKGLTRILQIFVLFLFSLCIINYSKKDNFKKLIKIHTNVASFLSAFLILIWASNFIWPNNPFSLFITADSQYAPRLKGFFEEPSVLALYLFTSLPFLLASFKQEFSKYNLAGIILQSICVFLTFSRAGFLAIFMLIILSCIIYRNKVLKNWKYFIILIQIFILLIISFESARETISEFVSMNIESALYPISEKFWSTRLRLEAYSYAVNAFQSHPFLGIGFFNFHFYSGLKFYPEINSNFYYNSPSTNNIFLTILSETGLLGVFLFIFMSCIILRKFLRMFLVIEEKERFILQAFFISIPPIITFFLFNSKLTHLFLWFYIGLIAAFFELNESSDKNLSKIDKSKQLNI